MLLLLCFKHIPALKVLLFFLSLFFFLFIILSFPFVKCIPSSRLKGGRRTRSTGYSELKDNQHRAFVCVRVCGSLFSLNWWSGPPKTQLNAQNKKNHPRLVRGICGGCHIWHREEIHHSRYIPQQTMTKEYIIPSTGWLPLELKCCWGCDPFLTASTVRHKTRLIMWRLSLSHLAGSSWLSSHRRTQGPWAAAGRGAVWLRLARGAGLAGDLSLCWSGHGAACWPPWSTCWHRSC